MFPAPGQPSPRPRTALRLLPARGRSSSAQGRRDGGDTQLWGGRVQIATAKSEIILHFLICLQNPCSRLNFACT